MSETPPLSGLLVIEAASMVMVPAAASVLADHGAEVIKIEPPNGDLNRRGQLIPGMPISEHEYPFLQDNRNKKSVVINLKLPAGQRALHRLIERADIFLTNYRSEALPRLGMDWETLKEKNPRLIYAHGTGFGDRGAEAKKPGFDTVSYWSRSALEATLFPLEGELGALAYGSGDHPTGMTLVSAILMALLQRERTGVGGRVTTSLIAAGAWANSTLIQAKLLGAEFQERLPRDQTINYARPYYRDSQGQVFKFTIVDHPGTWPRFCRAIEREDLLEDARFETLEARSENAPWLVAMLDKLFATQPITHWREVFAANDVPFSPLSSYDDVVSDEQLTDNGVFVEYELPGHGKVRGVNTPITLDGVPKVAPKAAPRLGEHTRSVLESLDLDEEDLASAPVDLPRLASSALPRSARADLRACHPECLAPVHKGWLGKTASA